MTKLKFPIKLNLGCGTDLRIGYINVDIRSDVGADLVHDITRQFPYSDGVADEIVARDVIEHLTLSQQEQLFTELHRLLISGGNLHLRVPDIDDIFERFSQDPDTRNLFLYGDTSVTGVWGAHKAGHSLLSLCTMAAMHGFKLQTYRRVETNFEIDFVNTGLQQLTGVIFINQSLGLGGAEYFNYQLLEWIRKPAVPVLAWVAKADFRHLLQKIHITANQLPIIVDLIGDWKGLIKGILLMPAAIVYYSYLVIKTRDRGVYFLTGYIEKILVTPVAKIFNQPVVWLEFGPLQQVFSKFFGLPKYLYRLVSQLPDYVIEPSMHTFIQNVSLTNYSHGRTQIVPCALSGLVLPSAEKIPFSVYSVSRLEAGKGQDLLIKAWPLVISRFPKSKLFIIGEGDFLNVLQNLVAELHLASSVIFLGRVADMGKTIAPFSLGVFPSVWPLEGFGMVVLEAMSAGKPIICSNLGPYTEIVDSQSAVFVDPRDIRQLANSIVDLLAYPEKASRLGLVAKQRFNEHFTWDKIGPVYQRVLTMAQVRCSIIRQLSS